MIRRLLLSSMLAASAAAAVAGPASAAPGDLPRLTAATPQNVIRDWYDDHSLAGDGHLSWSDQGVGTPFVNTSGIASQREPQSIRFDATMRVRGTGGLELCGYPSGTTGWMRAYQAEPGLLTAGTCPPVATGQQVGWFRYVYGRHSVANEFNRWHLMDLERYALVPMPATQGGPPAGTPTVWDNHWGTCLNLLSAPGCERALGAASLDVGVAAGTDKATQPHEVDSALIPIPAELQARLPAGRYQVVDLMNPYGIVREPGGVYGSVSCVTIDLAFGIPEDYVLHVDTYDANPGTCYVPDRFDDALTGPGDPADPMRGAEGAPPCVLPYRNPLDTSHCWPENTEPGHDPNDPPHSGPYPAAHTNSTGDPDVVTSTPFPAGTSISAILAARGTTPPPPPPSDSGAARPPAGGGAPAQPPGGAPKPQPPAPKPPAEDDDDTKGESSSKTAARTARSHTRTALRKVFGTHLSRVKVSCRLRKHDAATCRVSFRKRGGARYSGHIYLRDHRVHGRLRWQYRVDVKRRTGKHTTRVKRGYRSGGSATAR
jgi:hypothetical protein